ncbi:MAG TPA: hypothetical protein VFF26_11530 [Gallionella sp.]|nr:hypothetical protein [Gallionella sp.]
MAISSVSSGSVNLAAMQSPVHAENVRERENDGDSDDGASQSVAAAQPRPTVNTSGQTIGSIINVQA